MKKQTLFDLSSMPKMVLVITLVVMIGTLFGATSYLLKIPKTDLPIVNPVIETQCEIDSDCELVYVGSDMCPPCDTLSEEFQCLNKDEAKKVRDEWDNKFNTDLYIACSPCEVESDRYTCKCENGKCEKVKEGLVEEVSITTDKTEYEQGEIIKVAISNPDNPIYLPHVFGATRISFYQLKENFWKKLTQHCETNCISVCRNGVLDHTPCPLYAPPQYNYYKYEGPWEFQWNQKECIYENKLCGDKESYNEGSLNQVLAGKFKAEFCYFNEEDVDLTDMPGYVTSDKKKCVEKEFPIKEKSALDPRCGEKVQLFGNCPAYFEEGGYYEFNSEAGKCIEKFIKGSGCGVKSPFQTLEECQEVCEKKKCAGEGELINFPVKTNKNLPDVCCEELKGLAGFGIHENGECEQLIGGPFLTCMPCGNGICESTNNFDENECNCPEDCE